MTNTVILTRHGRKRIKERCGIKKSSAKRFAELAQKRGAERRNIKGSLRRWLDEVHDKCTDEDANVWVFGDKAFICSSQNVLITVLNIPTELRRMTRAAVRH